VVMKKVLYVSGSLGLGHVTRDLAIARELRKIRPDVKILWLTSEPASTVLRTAGESFVEGAETYQNNTTSG
jgi:predicted glycosyltransferase